MNALLPPVAAYLYLCRPESNFLSIARVRGAAAKLVVSHDGVRIKIEPNQILRGSVYQSEPRQRCTEAQKHFEMFVSTRTLAHSRRNKTRCSAVAFPAAIDQNQGHERQRVSGGAQKKVQAVVVAAAIH